MNQAMITHIIKSYEEVLKRYDFLKRELSQSQIDMIQSKIKEHSNCHKSWINNDENEDMIEIAVYSGGENVSLECNNCNSIIIDSEYFK